MGLSTKSIHLGQKPDLSFGLINLPIWWLHKWLIYNKRNKINRTNLWYNW